MNKVQEVVIEFGCEPENEGFARMAVAAYVARLNPTMEELSDIKTAVSEAVTNSIIHGYNCGEGIIKLICRLYDNELKVTVIDEGVGIENVQRAMEPMYTTKPDMERSGMGFAFMDEVTVESTPGIGTTVSMSKAISKEKEISEDLGIAVGYN